MRYIGSQFWNDLMLNDHPDKYRTATFRYSPADQTHNITSKQRVIDIMQMLTTVPMADLDAAVAASYHADASVKASHPLNDFPDLTAVAEQLWAPMKHALPDVERRNYIVAGGIYRDATWIGCMGHYMGTFERDWLGIPATNGAVTVRFSEGHAIRDGKIAESYVMIDFLDLMQQVGYSPIVPALGAEMQWPPPATLDGVVLTPQDNAMSKQSIERVLTMHRALGLYGGEPPTRDILDKIGLEKHWHPNFMWYGPTGIGSTRGLKGFEDYHQIPFIVAFPDRGGTDMGHFIRVGDGHYVVTGGWGYLQATHTGNDFLGLPPTGKRVNMRVMDFYRCNDETIVENWIPIDIPHLLLQMGVDVFGRMNHQLGRRHVPGMGGWLVR
ncbi:MAG: ester cyclase [Chloroflexota bacterium]